MPALREIKLTDKQHCYNLNSGNVRNTAKLMPKLFEEIMDIKTIRTDTDYQMALQEVEDLMHATLDTPEGDKLDILTTLIEAWEREHYPMSYSNPIETIRFV